jgi:hypothetical protein
MGKENCMNRRAKFISALNEAGIKGTVTEGKITPWLRRVNGAVRNYLMRIEDGSKKAGKSQAFFRNPLTSSLQPPNS